MEITKSYRRLWSIEDGIVMVVTDLHGDWDAYCRYRDRFVDLYASSQVDYLIFTGDLIHADEPAEDKSLEIVRDVIALQEIYGSAVIYLSGNHEMPHIYGVGLSKGDKVYTPYFEKALIERQCRSEVIQLFESLPFYIRTKAGVSLAHAGAPPFMVNEDRGLRILNWDHQEIISWVNRTLAQENINALRQGYTRLHGISYDALAYHYLAITGPDDPRYDHLLQGFIASSHPEFDSLLWPALFTRCEKEYGLADHRIFVDAMLQLFSKNFTSQQVLVTGHIPLRGSHKIVTRQHLRLASAYHAAPRTAGQYLLFDAGYPIKDMKYLLAGLGSVYASK